MNGCSCFILEYSEAKYIITADHCIEYKDDTTIIEDDLYAIFPPESCNSNIRIFSIKDSLYISDALLDIAIFKYNDTAPIDCIKLKADNKIISKGNYVINFGSPESFGINMITDGIIRSNNIVENS